LFLMRKNVGMAFTPYLDETLCIHLRCVSTSWWHSIIRLSSETCTKSEFLHVLCHNIKFIKYKYDVAKRVPFFP
jgi:hypothetical protein